MEDISAVRERLIAEGIRVLSEEGVNNLSLRRIAQACGVSCAAPYRHFRDKDDFLLAVADAAHDEWLLRQSQAILAVGDDTAMQLRVICKEYLRFLRDNPNFCTLILQKDENAGRWHLSRMFDRSSVTKDLIDRYAEEYGLSDEEIYNRIYALRALFYGASRMNQHPDTPLTESIVSLLCNIIDSQI